MGSHAKGTNTAFSDIDMLVVFKNDERENLKNIFDETISLKPTLSTLYQLYKPIPKLLLVEIFL